MAEPMDVEAKGGDAYDWDFAVVGGGSGGLSAAKEASKLGAKVVLFDFVKPSPQGTSWGLGGTCVNVGCIPKKMMHYAGLLGESFHDAQELGWQLEHPKHDWEQLTSTVRGYVRSLNFGYRSSLREKDVTYINAYATFKDAHTIEYQDKEGKKSLTFKYALIAVGGRPLYPDNTPGAREYGLTSDDIFYLDRSPGKTLCVGASYIALETAGFLASLGYETKVMVRSILLRGFDRDCADRVGESLEHVGVQYIRESTISKIEKKGDEDEEGPLVVTYVNHATKQETVEEFNTIVFAVGRQAVTGGMNLEEIGVKLHPKTRKVIGSDSEQSSVAHIYAIGDCLEGAPELTPPAIKAGKLLAHRLFAGSSKKMDYQYVPTTVFTPLEYGACGLTEEDAIQKYGDENVEIFHVAYNPLELASTHRMSKKTEIELENPAYGKLITLISEDYRVIGFHYVGPNAGEVTQGFAVAIKCGATKDDFDLCVGIHPTAAEEFTTIDITKRSGEDAGKSGC